MPAPILYLGDTSLDTAASYLAGVMHHAGWRFNYLASETAADSALPLDSRSLIILSDYPSSQLDADLQGRIVDAVRLGTGLLMIGGWESFHGCGGGWDQSLVSETLPVEISNRDDRCNCDQPTLVRLLSEHPITAGLPWLDRPPAIGGLNRFRPKPGATVLLAAEHYRVWHEGGEFVFRPDGSDPLLVVDRFGKGRVGALATDVAPHWVGGLVDWGSQRVAAQCAGAEAIEVGDLYARFLQQMLAWIGNLPVE